MNITQEIVNGYINPKNKFKFDRSMLNNSELPSKIGGQPVNLNIFFDFWEFYRMSILFDFRVIKDLAG